MSGMYIKLLVVMLALSSKSYAQVPIDTGRLILNSKMHLISYLEGYEDMNYYESYLNFAPSVLFLASTGFENNYIFFKIKVKDTVVIKQKIDTTKTLLVPFFKFKDEYVTFAFNSVNKLIYKLDGGECNDLSKFMNDVISYYSTFYSRKLNKNNFHKHFSVDGFNFQKL